jgi:hypothetical protein
MKLAFLCRPAVAVLSLALVTLSPAHATDGFWERSYEPEQKTIKNVDVAIKRFNDFDVRAEKDPAFIGDYLRSGIVLSDLACEQWLSSLSRADRDVSFAKDIMNIVGNLIIGIAGINGANPSSLARGSLGLAAGNSSIDAFKNEVILGALADIEAKLVEGRKITAATIKSYATATTHYDDAKGLLLSYHRDCSPNAIKILLKTSLAAVKYEAADVTLTGPIVKAKTTATVSKLLEDLYPGDPAKELTTDDLYKLYVMKIAAPGPNPPPFVAAMITPAAQTLSDDFSSKNEATRLGLLQTIAELKQFDQRYKADKTAGIAKVDAVVQKATQETTAAAIDVANAQKALPISDAAKLARSKVLSSFFDFPQSTLVTPTLLAELRKQTGSLMAAKSSPSTKVLESASKVLEAKTEILEQAKKEKIANEAAPPAKISSPDVFKTGVAPVSVNAVLVPVTPAK